MNRPFIRVGERYININAIASFEVLPTGYGDLRLVSSQAICVDPREARMVADYLTVLSADLRPPKEFPSGAYPIWTRSSNVA